MQAIEIAVSKSSLAKREFLSFTFGYAPQLLCVTVRRAISFVMLHLLLFSVLSGNIYIILCVKVKS